MWGNQLWLKGFEPTFPCIHAQFLFGKLVTISIYRFFSGSTTRWKTPFLSVYSAPQQNHSCDIAPHTTPPIYNFLKKDLFRATPFRIHAFRWRNVSLALFKIFLFALTLFFLLYYHGTHCSLELLIAVTWKMDNI